MPTEQPDGNIRDLKDFKDIQRACCKRYASQPGGPQGAGGLAREDHLFRSFAWFCTSVVVCMFVDRLTLRLSMLC